MKAITIPQPWASLIAIGAKSIETRPYRTAYRGRLAIHAAKTATPVDDPYYRSLLEAAGLAYDELPYGVILAVCRLEACERVTHANCPCYPEYAFSDFRPGWYAWHLGDITPLAKPVACRGRRGLWECPVAL